MAKKKIIFECPIKVFLTDNGVNALLATGKKFSKIKSANNVDRYGINLSRFTFNAVRQLIELKYSQNIEMPVSDLSLLHNDVTDIVKLLMYHILYNKFDSEIWTLLLHSPLVDYFTGIKTGILLKESTVVKDSLIESICKKYNLDLNKIKSDLLAPIHLDIINDYDLTIQKKNRRMLLSEKYINSIRDIVFLCMALAGQESSAYKSFAMLLQDNIATYFKKSMMANHLTRVLYDILAIRENRSLEAFLQRQNSSITLEALQDNKELKRKMLAEMNKTSDGLLIGISVESSTTSKNAPINNLIIEIFSSSFDYQKLNMQINESLNLPVGNYEVEDLVVPEISKKINPTNNPFYQLPFFERDCNNNEIAIKVLTHQSTSRDRCIIKLILSF